MIEVGTRHVSARTGGWVEVVERTPDSLSFERLLKPDTGRADPHLHLDSTQTSEAVQGEGLIELNGKERPFTAGATEVINPDSPHRDPWNPGPGDLIIRTTFEPCPPFIEVYAKALAHYFREGTTNDQDELPLLQIFAIAVETDAQSFRAGIPVAVQRATLPLTARFARLRGYGTEFGNDI